MNTITVSIITPMYKASAYVELTIQSVLAQSFRNWEMIIIDDASPDGGASVAAVQKWVEKDSRIQLVKLTENRGSSGARNEGIRRATGQYIALLDSDDLWDSNFLSSQLSFLQSKSASFVFSSFRRIDSQGREILQPVKVREKVSYRDLLVTNDIGCLTAFYDSQKLGKFYLDESLKSVRDDYELWLRILKKSEAAFGNPQVLASYRVHGSSTTGNKFKMILPQWNIYYKYEKLGLIRSMWYLATWAFHGFLRYR